MAASVVTNDSKEAPEDIILRNGKEPGIRCYSAEIFGSILVGSAMEQKQVRRFRLTCGHLKLVLQSFGKTLSADDGVSDPLFRGRHVARRF